MTLTGTIEDSDFDDCGIKRTITAKGKDKSDRNLICQRAVILSHFETKQRFDAEMLKKTEAEQVRVEREARGNPRLVVLTDDNIEALILSAVTTKLSVDRIVTDFQALFNDPKPTIALIKRKLSEHCEKTHGVWHRIVLADPLELPFIV